MGKLLKTAKITLVMILLCSFLFAGHYLVVEQPLEKTDAIIILGGGNGERELEASHLYKKNLADFVILSNGGTREKPSTTKTKQEVEWLISFGVPEGRVLTDLSSLSTYDNAVNTKNMMLQKHFTSATVVSSTYHMRRAQYIFEKVYKDSGVKLRFKAAEVENYHPNFWWSTAIGWKYTTREYIKLAGYYVIYGLLRE